MSFLQKSCVVACDLPSLLVPFLRDVFDLVCASGWDAWCGHRDDRSKHARKPSFAHEFGRDRWREECGPPGMWSTYSSSRDHHLRRLQVYEEEGQATSTREEAWRRRRPVATAMTEVMEETQQILRELEERWRHADVHWQRGDCTAQVVPCVREQLGDWDLCHGDVQHPVVSTCGTCKTLVCAMFCR